MIHTQENAPLVLPSAITFSSWILLDADTVEKEIACLSILQALKMRPQVFHLRLNPFFSFLPPSLWRLSFFRSKEEGALTPPWPDFVLGTGRLGSVAASLIKQRASTKTFAVCLNRPKAPPHSFDVIVSTAEDPIEGENVLTTIGGFSSLTPARLKEEAHLWWQKLNFLPQPWISVWIGPTVPKARFSEAAFDHFTTQLKNLLAQTGGGLMIYCFSPLPLPLLQKLEAVLTDVPYFLWKGEGENPSLAFLGMADYLLAPADLTSLIPDFLATDKPLYLYPPFSAPLRNQNSIKYLYEKGLARPFKGQLDFWSRPFFSETQGVADALLTRLMASR